MARLWPQPPVCSNRGYSTDADLTIARAHASRVPERCDRSARRRGCGLGMGRVARRWPPTSASRDGVDALFVAADASCVCEGRRFAAAIRLAHHFRMTRGLDRPRTHTSTAHARAAAGVGASGAPRGYSGCAWVRPRASVDTWWCARRAVVGSVALRVSRGRVFRVPSRGSAGYLVDPASSHMLVSKIKPCMSKYKRLVL